METERLIIDQIKETDKEDYFINISHDKKVLETFICRYADAMEEFDFSSYPGCDPFERVFICGEIIHCEGAEAKAPRQRERCHYFAGRLSADVRRRADLGERAG